MIELLLFVGKYLSRRQQLVILLIGEERGVFACGLRALLRHHVGRDTDVVIVDAAGRVIIAGGQFDAAAVSVRRKTVNVLQNAFAERGFAYGSGQLIVPQDCRKQFRRACRMLWYFCLFPYICCHQHDNLYRTFYLLPA